MDSGDVCVCGLCVRCVCVFVSGGGCSRLATASGAASAVHYKQIQVRGHLPVDQLFVSEHVIHFEFGFY